MPALSGRPENVRLAAGKHWSSINLLIEGCSGELRDLAPFAVGEDRHYTLKVTSSAST